jgi:hypothetical protein
MLKDQDILSVAFGAARQASLKSISPAHRLTLASWLRQRQRKRRQLDTSRLNALDANQRID